MHSVEAAILYVNMHIFGQYEHALAIQSFGVSLIKTRVGNIEMHGIQSKRVRSYMQITGCGLQIADLLVGVDGRETRRSET